MTGSGALICTPENAATAFGLRLLYSRSRPAIVSQEGEIKPRSNVQPQIWVSSMDLPSRVSRLEERTDNHGDAACDMRIKHGQTDIDIKDIYSQINLMKGSLRMAKWIYGSIMALIAIVVEWCRK